MYTPIQLEAIKLFGRKELTEGCIIETDIFPSYPLYFEVKNTPYKTDSVIIKSSEYMGEEWAISIADFEILGHPVQWHDVFARLKEKGIAIQMFSFIEKSGGEIVIYWEGGHTTIDCNPCLSPMEQPALIEQLLLLSN